MNRKRIEQVIGYMERGGIPQMLVSAPPALRYLTGLHVEPMERFCALYLRTDGTLRMFCNPIICPEAEGLPWVSLQRDGEDPLRELGGWIREGILGVDNSLSASVLVPLLRQNPRVKPVLASSCIDRVRMIKDAEEQRCLRQAAGITDRVMRTLLDTFDPGLSEREMMEYICALHVKFGADDSKIALAQFGPHSAQPHRAPDGTGLQRGDAVLFDMGAPCGGYWSDMTRTFFYQTASELQQKVSRIVLAANRAATKFARPGIPLSEIDRCARKVIEDAGYGSYFIHRLGHGIGLEMHEMPNCSGDSEIAAQAGMCFSIEPGIYLPGQFGVRIENVILMTEDGAETLTTCEMEAYTIR